MTSLELKDIVPDTLRKEIRRRLSISAGKAPNVRRMAI
jgi:hypothetical protein